MYKDDLEIHPRAAPCGDRQRQDRWGNSQEDSTDSDVLLQAVSVFANRAPVVNGGARVLE